MISAPEGGSIIFCGVEVDKIDFHSVDLCAGGVFEINMSGVIAINPKGSPLQELAERTWAEKDPTDG